jgi:hypothetical protein
MKPAVIIAALVIVAIRPFLLVYELGPHAQSSYEAFSHLLVGGLYGAYAYWRVSFGNRPLDRPVWMLYAANALTAVEVVCAGIKVLGPMFLWWLRSVR